MSNSNTLKPFKPKEHDCVYFAVDQIGAKAAVVTRDASGESFTMNLLEIQGKNLLPVKTSKIELSEERTHLLFQPDSAHLIFAANEPVLMHHRTGNDVRDFVTLEDGSRLQTSWAAFPNTPVLSHEHQGKTTPLRIPEKVTPQRIKPSFSEQLQVAGDLVSVHCNHMDACAYTAEYKYGKFSNWKLHEGEHFSLTEKGLFKLEEEGISLIPATKLKSVPIDR